METFNGCTSLENVTFGKNSQCRSINIRAFQYCESLKNIELPATVADVESYAFNGCTSLANISFGEESQLTFIGVQAFYKCKKLTNVNFGKNSQLETIHEEAFADCTSLEIFNVPDSVTTIYSEAFFGCAATQLVDGVYYIDNWALLGISSSTTPVLRTGTVGISANMLSSINDRVSSIEIPNSIKYINESALENYKALKSITYNGTGAQWEAIEFGDNWCKNISFCKIYCSDGDNKVIIDGAVESSIL